VPKITRFLGVALSASSPKSFDADQVSILTSVPVISDQNGNCEANKGSVFVDPGRWYEKGDCCLGQGISNLPR
jgi:hypothetical protein